MSNSGLPSDPLRTRLGELDLASPVVLAAGTAGTLDEMTGVLDVSRLGGITSKSITREPREGNALWRVVPLEVGMLNAIGLANPGLDAFMSDYAPRIRSVPTNVIGSIAGNSVDDYAAVARAFATVGPLAAVEINVSCPNVHGGTEFGADPGALRELLAACRGELGEKPMFVKLSPIAVGTPGMVEIARTAIEAGADALCLCNTVPAMAVDVETRRPELANVTGGLSGPAVHPIALKIVYDVYRSIARDASVPIVGIGGVVSWREAAAFILAGAAAVQVGTMTYADPRAAKTIVRGLGAWTRRQRAGSVRELTGGLNA
ncbi:MAG: dihydroorotate dehydrogenase [Planctomycetota bacterium]